MPSAPKYFAQLANPYAIQITGADAAKIVNNLATNDVAKLKVDNSFESFITDVRGWVVAHGAILKQTEQIWLLGSHPQPSRIVDHVDRYIIREDAQVINRSQDYALFVLGDGPSGFEAGGEIEGRTQAIALDEKAGCDSFESSAWCDLSCPLPVIGPGTLLLGCLHAKVESAIDDLSARGSQMCDAEQFSWLRISSFWPVQAADFGDKTIPQELDRDYQAISFTKGCYLGQETIARLDARGQLQKKLSLVELAGQDVVKVDEPLFNGDREVGRITSSARDPVTGQVRGLAMLKRGSFAAGTALACQGRETRVVR